MEALVNTEAYYVFESGGVISRDLARVILFPALGRNLPYLLNGLSRSPPAFCQYK